MLLRLAWIALWLTARCCAQLRLIEIDPGHSHLAALHTHMLPGASGVVHIYSPLSAELVAHLAAIQRDNARAADPAHWSVELFAGPDYLERFAREQPGAIVALSGRNALNIRYLEAALAGGQHVFADKPWIIDREAFPRLEAALEQARAHRLVTMDWMSLRSEAAYRLVRDLVREQALFGAPEPGSVEQPAVRLENLHALLKYSGGVPQRRPAAFLDVRQQGEGMADVGTHLVDIAQWTLFPGQEISYRTDIRMERASHSALTLNLDQLRQLTGESDWPAYLKDRVSGGTLTDYTNGTCVYTVKGVHVGIKVAWQFEGAAGEQDSYFASYQGTRARVELRAGAKEHFVPQIYVTPSAAQPLAEWEPQLSSAVKRLEKQYPGLTWEKQGRWFHLTLPAARGGDGMQAMFRELAGYIRDWNSFPEYETANLLAKYYVTTAAVAMANAGR